MAHVETGHIHFAEPEDDDQQPTTFPCSICSATFVTRLSLTRHMILHEDDVKNVPEESNEESNEPEETIKSELSESDADIPVPNIPQANLLESILKNGSKASYFEKSHSGIQASRPIPNLKPLPGLLPALALKAAIPQIQQPIQVKNFQCPLCSVYFGKKEDLARHTTRTHGGSRFTCPYCGRNISRRDHLKRHIKNVHPEYCTANEIGPFLADPNASRTAKEMHAENFAIQYGIPVEPQNKKRKLSSSAGAGSGSESLFNEELPQQQISQNEEMLNGDYLEEEGDNEFEDEEDGNENITIVPQFALSEPMDDEDDEGTFEDDTIDTQNGYSLEDHQNEDNTYLNSVNTFDSNMYQPTTVTFPERKFKCEMCDAAFMSKINMIRHMSTHSIVRPHKCSVCGKGFLRKEHLSKHLSSVHSGLKYKCQFCHKDISRKDHLLRHIRNCHHELFRNMPPEMIDSEPKVASIDERSLNQNFKLAALACDMCPDTFHHIDELHEHQSAVHSDVRKFKCAKCPKAFKRKEHLMKHQATHMTDSHKAFSCNKCGLVFPKIEEVYAHIREAHDINSQSSKEIFPCNLCENAFSTNVELIQHLKTYHGVSKVNILHNSNSSSSISPHANPRDQQIRRPAYSQIRQIPSQMQVHGKIRQSTPSASGLGPNTTDGSSVQAKLQSLLGIHVPVKNKVDEGSLGSLMGLINKGSLSLSRVATAKN